ncbi:alkaline phosphatase family protein [Gardnerella vaginalis]|uniref:alkaline phosphatase family protein n=1 Tax=Gardnerella vaginalis TaxID=2702 RepID=UPI0039F037A0
MNVDVLFQKELLQFVSNVKYGDFTSSETGSTSSNSACKKANGGALHLSSILPALSDVIDAPVTTEIHKNPGILRESFGFPKSRCAIVVLIDGLGYWNILMRQGHAPYLRSLLNDSVNQRPILTCVPSTTAAAMSTFGTGTCPGLTCMTGYTQKNAKTGKLAQLIQFSDAPDPQELQQQPTIFESLVQKGVRTDSVGMPKFEHSPLTCAAFRGANYISGGTPKARIMKAAETTRTPGLTYLYLRDTDKVGHNYGWNSNQWVAVFEQVDEQLRILKQNCAPGTLIVITADHGMIQSDPNLRIDIAKNDNLMRGVAMVGGEPRSVMLYADPDTNPEDIINRWKETLGNNAFIRSKKQAIQDGVFGKVSSSAEAVLGDVLVQARDAYTIVDSRIQSEKAMSLRSVHGSMTHLEVDIPCLIDVK